MALSAEKNMLTFLKSLQSFVVLTAFVTSLTGIELYLSFSARTKQYLDIQINYIYPFLRRTQILSRLDKLQIFKIKIQRYPRSILRMLHRLH